jgi:hypothetical protein
VKWPDTDQLKRAKLSLEVILLTLLVGAMLFVLTVDREAAIKVGLMGK